MTSLRSSGGLVLFLGDLVLLPLALAAAAWIRAGFAPLPLEGPTLLRGLASVLVLQLCIYYGDLYDDRALRSRIDFFLRLGRSFAAAAVLLALLSYVWPAARVAPLTLLIAAPLAATVILLWHTAHRFAAGHEALRENLLILGTGHTAQQIADEVLRRPLLGYHIVGFLGEHPAEVGRRYKGLTVLGTATDVLRLVHTSKVGLVVVALEDRRGRLPVDDLLDCRVAGVRVEDAPGFFERLTGKLMVSDIRPSWFVFSPGFTSPRLFRVTKPLFERLLAGLLLVLLAPLLGLLALLVRLDSRGPAFFRQPRVGLRGRTFDIVKLRTMRTDAEAATGPVWASPEDDPRITRVGRILRTLRLDELPQLLNIARGEMSFVGPRPERPHFVEKLRQVIPYYDERHSVRPGITGWAQVRFGYSSTIEDSERKLQFDLYYVKNMSAFLDVAVVLDTFKVMLLGRGAR